LNDTVDDVKDYFGEKIGLYFLFLQHYVTLLMWPAFLGLITFIVKSVYDEPENFLMPYFAVFTVVWSSFFMEFWKRRQSTASLKWGSSGFEEEEQDRPQFKGEQINSYIDGQPMTYFSSAENNRRVTIVNVSKLCYKI
jgi:anoctamin-10/anoctamin-7